MKDLKLEKESEQENSLIIVPKQFLSDLQNELLKVSSKLTDLIIDGNLPEKINNLEKENKKLKKENKEFAKKIWGLESKFFNASRTRDEFLEIIKCQHKEIGDLEKRVKSKETK
jgi:predicted RNase H-like nuclease (RuvC/YqgF family)